MAAQPGQGQQVSRDNACVEVGLTPHNGPADGAFVLLKVALEMEDGRLLPAEPEPLAHDFRVDEPTLHPGTDFWLHKELVDVVVQGSAFAPAGEAVGRMTVSVQVGSVQKRLEVLGRRRVRWDGGGAPLFGEPEPFVEMPLNNENSYGGFDRRVRVSEDDPRYDQIAMQVDHPGNYPRNPWGKGYVVLPGSGEELELPNLEDPDDLLAPERFVVGDAARWWRQPLPWCLDWVHPMTYQRYLYFLPQMDAWFPAPQDEKLPEVERGFLQPGCRAMMGQRQTSQGPHPLFRQAASHGMRFPSLEPGTPVSLEGMHPEQRQLTLEMPAPPHLDVLVEGTSSNPRARLTNVVCRPAEKRLLLTYAAADLAGSSRLSCAAAFKPVRVLCTGRVDPALVLGALERGADGVIVAGCRAGDCHYHGGNCQAAFRMSLLQRLLEQTGRDPRRLRMIWLGADEARKLVGEIEEMTFQLTEMDAAARSQASGHGA